MQVISTFAKKSFIQKSTQLMSTFKEHPGGHGMGCFSIKEAGITINFETSEGW